MNNCHRSWRVPDHANQQHVRIHYWRHTVFLICIEGFGRIAVSDAEIAFCHFARFVCRRMHRNARMSQKQR